MAVFDAGESRGVYLLEAKQALAQQEALIKNYQQLAKAAAFKPPPIPALPIPPAPRAPAVPPPPPVSPARAQSFATEQRAIAGLEAQQARLARVQGDGARAATLEAQAQDRLRGALVRTDTTITESIALQRQLTSVQQQATAASTRASAAQARAAKGAGLGTAGGLPILPRTVESFGTQAIDQFKSGLISIVGPAAIATAAIAAIPAAFDLAKVGADADLVAKRFDGLARSAGTTGDALIGVLRSASGGEIDDFNLRLSASRALMLGVADSTAEFTTLLNIARDRAQIMGISTTDAFNRLVLGLGKAEPELLDELGIVVNGTEANAAFARSIGVSTDALTKQQRSQALAAAVIAQGNVTLAQTGGAVQSNAAAFARAGAAAENAKTAFGSFLSQGLAPIAAQFATTVESTQALVSRIQNIGTVTPEAAAATAAYAAEMEKSGSVTLANAAYEAALAAARQKTTTVTTAAVPPIVAATNAQLGYVDAIRAFALASPEAAEAARQKAQADQVAAVDAQTHAIAQQKLEAQVKSAAEELIKAGPAGAQTAALLANSSSDVDVLTAAYYRLAVAQGQAAQAKTNADALLDQRAGERDSGGARTANQITFESNQDRKAAQAAAARAKEIADAKFQLDLATAKTNADKIALFKRQLAGTTDKAERLRIQATLAGLKNSAGAGAAKGISALDQDAIQAGETLQAQLDEVNRLLERQNLTAHQRNDLLEKRRSLEEQITDEIDKQARASVDAQLGAVHDAQARLKETREAAGLERALAGGRISGTQQEAARLRLAEIGLEQQKRALDIQQDQKVAGVALTDTTQQQAAAAAVQATAAQRAITQPLPLPNVAQLPPPQAPIVTVNLTLNVDKSGNATVTATDPGVILNLIGNGTTFRNLSGGTP